jgi:hypothetical protein
MMIDDHLEIVDFQVGCKSDAGIGRLPSRCDLGGRAEQGAYQNATQHMRWRQSCKSKTPFHT